MPRITLVIIVLALAGRAAGQDKTLPGLDVLPGSKDTVLTRSDSLFIFSLLDSLLTLPPVSATQLILRAGYNSNITATGRPFALGNYGLSSGIGIIHQSGFFADISGYWSREYSPSYFLTTTTAGYLWSPNLNWTLAGEYNRFWYNLSDNSYIAYNNSLSMTAFWHKGRFNARADYSLYFGKKTGHRLNPAVAMDLKWDKKLGLDRIRIMPMFSVLLGTESITTYVPYSKDPMVIRERIRRGLPLFYNQTGTKAGIMNYNFSLPLTLRKGGWDLLFNYSYNIPKALPGETLGLSKGGFFSFSVTRYIDLRKGN